MLASTQLITRLLSILFQRNQDMVKSLKELISGFRALDVKSVRQLTLNARMIGRRKSVKVLGSQEKRGKNTKLRLEESQCVAGWTACSAVCTRRTNRRLQVLDDVALDRRVRRE